MDKKEQRKAVKKVFIALVIIMVGFAAIFAIMNYLNYFKYRGITFEIDKVDVKGMTLYRTSIPVLYNNKTANYNLYFRYDPRELDKIIPIDGNLTFRKNIVLETTTKELFCGGDWNYFQLQIGNVRIFDIELLVKNSTMKYTPSSNYMFMTINEGEKTEIKQIGENQYEINVANCEIAPVADRLVLEAIAKYQELYPKK